MKEDLSSSPTNFTSSTRKLPEWLKRAFTAALTPVILLAVASMGLVASEVPRQVAFSPFDEYVYLDYLHKFPTQIVERQGEETGAFARNELSCRGVFYYGSYGQGCNSGRTTDDQKFPYNGGQGADIYTPLYFAITWVAAAPLVATGVDQLDAGRLVGGIWLALGVVLLYLCLRKLDVGKLLATGLGLLVIATPAVHWANTYVSTDAPTLAAASGLALIGIRIWQGRSSPFVLVPFAMFATALKVQNLGAFGVVALALIFSRLHRESDDNFPSRLRQLTRDRTVIAVILAAASALALQVIWVVIRAKLAVGPGGLPLSGQAHLTGTALIDEAVKFFHQVGSAGLPVGFPEEAATAALSILTIVAVTSLAFERRSKTVPTKIISRSTAIIALVYGPLLAIGTSLAVGYYFPLTPRYGLVLLPAFVICIAIYLRRWRISGPVAFASGAILFAAASFV